MNYLINFNEWLEANAVRLIEKFVKEKKLQKEWFNFVDLEFQTANSQFEELINEK